jgi:hypothetical protein
MTDFKEIEMKMMLIKIKVDIEFSAYDVFLNKLYY